MTALAQVPERINIDSSASEDIRRAVNVTEAGAELVLRRPDGTELVLTGQLQRILAQALQSLAENGSVTIGHLPSELTSSTAADILGVSRPTLMKWARDGDIRSHKVGTHTRFDRDEVMKFRAERSAARRKAFDDLRALEDELDSDG